ncbi:uncharacterized protein MELLADRAFT_67644 [Melampsora larici-populina 98AG31]|uniref:Uncharacterized protein n=1 Tax=Melampsora larici-populina (strain 98AG31 / pathotype 3-4-7) TaxID=747676 RepID=F4S3X2_MELLP|nr:uncharacterized protein MELLADRAFT_67644 [Melampsora larici-populina 98AG31]EGG00606.1 hypothetical protein MELLADRAFT_67644 [Melampsora larici-populina 98AG31]
MPTESHSTSSGRRKDSSSSPRTKRRGHHASSNNIEPIHPQDDFYLKSAEFRLWLKEEKNKYIDQIDTDKARTYFAKFARHWNRGKLDSIYYELPIHLRASTTASSSHTWSFQERSTLEREKAQNARHEAVAGPLNPAPMSQKPLIGPPRPPQMVPASTSTARVQHRSEEDGQQSSSSLQRRADAKRKRNDEREEERSNRATGKDRLLEKKREKREGNTNYQREQEDRTAVDLDDRTMFGTDSSFQAAVRERDRAAARRNKTNFKQEKQMIQDQKIAVMRSKEDDTMAMLRALADSKFKPSA